MSVIATLVNHKGEGLAFELTDISVPPMYITRGGKLFAVQPWELPPLPDVIHATYRRIHCLDVTEMDCTIVKEEKAA